MAQHLRERLEGDPDPDDQDHERAGRGQEPDQPAVQRHAAEGALGEHGHEADRRDGRRETEAEGDDQREPEADPVQRDRAQQDDEGGWAGQQAGSDADAEQAAAVDRVVVVVIVAVSVRVAVRMRMSALAQPRQEHRGPDGHDEQPGRERQPRVERLRDDELREQQGDEARARRRRPCGSR